MTKDYSQDQCKADTQLHINQVRYFMLMVVHELAERAVIHDASKLESPELEIFTMYTPRLKSSTYGSEEYKRFLKEMQVALDHHYAVNPHHPEHYENGIRGMNLVDVVEMFCDWYAATMRHADGDIMRSIDVNQKRFNYSDDLAAIFRNTVAMLGGENEGT